MAVINKAMGNILLFWCPGCEDAHQIHTNENGWVWNGDVDKPTITPSIKVEGGQWKPEDSFYKPQHSRVPAGGKTICHSFITDGTIDFLNDCTHDKRNTNMYLPEWPY